MKSVFQVLAVLGQVLVSESGRELLPESFYNWIEKPVNRLQNRFRSEFLPTLWCGVRDVAPDRNAVSAIYPHLDSCCRAHDLCPLVVDRGQCHEGICNPSFIFPILSCQCEERFRNCLQALPTEKALGEFPLSWTERFLSDLISRGYFKLFPQMFDRKCIKKAKPIKGCARWSPGDVGDVQRRCLEFAFDTKGQETWQLFDIEDFNAGWHHMREFVNEAKPSNLLGRIVGK